MNICTGLEHSTIHEIKDPIILLNRDKKLFMLATVNLVLLLPYSSLIPSNKM